MQIEINGVLYERIESEKPKKESKISKGLMSLITMGAIMQYSMQGSAVTSRTRPSIDIVEEFKLIQQKKSKLSRSQRDWVVFQFHKLYKSTT